MNIWFSYHWLCKWSPWANSPITVYLQIIHILKLMHWRTLATLVACFGCQDLSSLGRLILFACPVKLVKRLVNSSRGIPHLSGHWTGAEWAQVHFGDPCGINLSVAMATARKKIPHWLTWRERFLSSSDRVPTGTPLTHSRIDISSVCYMRNSVFEGTGLFCVVFALSRINTSVFTGLIHQLDIAWKHPDWLGKIFITRVFYWQFGNLLIKILF